ncbi:MAG: HAMP domain-containing protein [Solirubrobacterales bacterium]|nr:HAMP domain-containing protein [Solirubrobacterales bacterium]MBV9166470.1 HAMP domain-containing protein [Solirubrobacterales bacterium]MBV9535719.1 HAMP domain-containing protein [Solirubrobacterales bacterium]
MRLRQLTQRLRHPQTTVRWRLTLLYSGLFLVSGAALLAITYTLVSHAAVQPSGPRALLRAPPPNAPRSEQVKSPAFFHRSGNHKFIGPPPQALAHIRQRLLGSNAGRAVVINVGSNQRISDLHQLIEESGIALGIMAIISGLLGWLVAGRVLRPLRTMTAKTQQISEANLHERLDLRGPRDELRQLAETIDGLLARLEAAFDAQRRFVANASHELRTPLTATRALLEMAMTDPRATVASFRAICEQVLDEGEQQEQLIDALLALAQSQRGIDRRQPMDLAEVVRDVVDARDAELAVQGLTLEVSLERAPISGDRRLVQRLVSNLVDNAIRHNVDGGTVQLSVEAGDGNAALHIANTGPVIPSTEVERLLQPFQRLGADRVGHRDGLGLGLSIVAAIANAHGARLAVRPRDGSGLDVGVRFPLSPTNAGDSVPAIETEPPKYRARVL